MHALIEEMFSRLKERLGEAKYHKWFSRIKPISWEDGLLKFEVPSKFFKDWLRENYRTLIEETGRTVSGEPIRVEFEVGAGRDEPEPAAVPPASLQEPVKEPDPGRIANLNPKYTFDRFVVGPCNQYANAATFAVAQAPGKAYNPLFIYGGVGLGKTHLMQAAANMALNHSRKYKVLYLSSESFTNDFINAIANRTTDRFRRKYRNVDVLLIDDIQFMSGQVRTQEQFFHTFNVLWDAHKQIILSSDRPPQDIPDVEERLVSRFEWGLVVDLQPPDRETRIAILRKEAEYSGIEVSDEVIFFIADNIKSNIRKLEGAMIKVASYASLIDAPLSIETAELVMSGIMEENLEPIISMDNIQKKVSEFYDIRLADMKSSRRPKAIAFPRQMAMYLSRNLTARSLSEIGEAFGGRDHTTVLHACKIIEERSSGDKNIANTITHLTKKLRQERV